MAKFAVTITRSQFVTVIIEADLGKDAAEIALNQFDEGEYDKAPWMDGETEVSDVEFADDK
jgi:hypothetical protein